jgi:hypothetical protein
MANGRLERAVIAAVVLLMRTEVFRRLLRPLAA